MRPRPVRHALRWSRAVEALEPRPLLALASASPPAPGAVQTIGVATRGEQQTHPEVLGDYDGDGKTDLTVYRPPTGQWFSLLSSGGARVSSFGGRGDVPLQGDFDGDGKTDLAIYRPSNGTWYVNFTPGGPQARSAGGPQVTPFGAPRIDIPVPGDYNGDGKTDIAVYRPTTGQWFVLLSGGGVIVQQFGAPDRDIPVPGDYDGTGHTEFAVFRPSTAQWFILGPTGGRAVSFGAPRLDLPVPADYSGGGRTEIAVWRPTTATWFIQGSTRRTQVFQFGRPGDIPVPADYDGDGREDLAVFDPGTATRFVLRSQAGPEIVPFGAPSLDIPLPLPIAFRGAERLFNGPESPGGGLPPGRSPALPAVRKDSTVPEAMVPEATAPADAARLVDVPLVPAAGPSRHRPTALIDAALDQWD